MFAALQPSVRLLLRPFNNAGILTRYWYSCLKLPILIGVVGGISFAITNGSSNSPPVNLAHSWPHLKSRCYLRPCLASMEICQPRHQSSIDSRLSCLLRDRLRASYFNRPKTIRWILSCFYRAILYLTLWYTPANSFFDESINACVLYIDPPRYIGLWSISVCLPLASYLGNLINATYIDCS